MKKTERLEKLHTMEEFGPTNGTTKEIRISNISGRVHPKIGFPHKHDFYQLLAVSQGGGWHEMDFQRYQIRPWELFFLKPGQVHRWQTSPKSRGYIIEFTEQAFLRESPGTSIAWSAMEIPDRMAFSKASKLVQKSIFSLLQLMKEEYDSQFPDFEISLKNYLMPLLIELHRYGHKKKAAKQTGDLVLNRFHVLLRDHFRVEHGVTFYAEKLKTSPKALSMRIRRGLGRPAREIIRDRCLLEAKRLLAHSALSIAEVGYEIGFADPNYFSRFFRHSEGINPGDFRIKARTLP